MTRDLSANTSYGALFGRSPEKLARDILKVSCKTNLDNGKILGDERSNEAEAEESVG